MLPPRTSCKQSAARPASLEALAGRPIVHNSTRFSSTPRVANIPRYALHVHNALRRNQAASDPHLCPKSHCFFVANQSLLDGRKRIAVGIQQNTAKTTETMANWTYPMHIPPPIIGNMHVNNDMAEIPAIT